MDPLTLGLIGGGIDLLGSLFGKKEAELTPQEKAMMETLQKMRAMPDIDWAKTLPQLQAYQAQQVEAPILESDRAALQTAFESLPATDPGLKKAQMEALGQLQRQGGEGLTLSDIAALRGIQGEQAAQARRNVANVQAQMQARGMGGSGADIAAQLQGAQAGMNRASQEQLAIAAQRQQAKRDAVLGAGDLASKFRSQQFGEDTAKAQAKDVVSRFNEEMAANRAARNVAAGRGAQGERLAERRTAEGSRVGTENLMATNRAGIEEKKYEAGRKRILDEGAIATGIGAKRESAQEAQDRASSALWSSLGDVATAGAQKIFGK